MVENTHGRHAFGDLTNNLSERPVLSNPEKSTSGIKIRRVEKNSVARKESDENAINSNRRKGIVFGNLFDGVAKENFEMPSIFRHTKVQHMAPKAAGLLPKVSDLADHFAPIDSFDLSDKDQDSSLDSQGEYDEDDNEMNGDLSGHFSSSELANKTTANDGECLTQEEIVASSGNQKPQSSLNFTTGGDMPSSSVQHASVRTGGSEEAVATKSCACSFCLKVLKKSISFTRLLEAKQSKGNEYAANVARYNPKQPMGMEFKLSQQQRSLFSYTYNALVRESTQLNASFVKLKEFERKLQNRP